MLRVPAAPEIARRLIEFMIAAGGTPEPETWLAAADYERRLPAGAPKLCNECPMTRGGIWHDALVDAVRRMTPDERSRLGSLGCHVDQARICAGVIVAIRAASCLPAIRADAQDPETSA